MMFNNRKNRGRFMTRLWLSAGVGLAACASPADSNLALMERSDAVEGEVALAPTRIQAQLIASRAYVYGFPIVLMERTRAVVTAVPEAGPTGAPINQIAHLDTLPDASFRTVVRPNRDTVYSSAYLDLSQQPQVLTLPDVPDDRFTMFAFLDAWTNSFAAPGTRTNDNRASKYAIVGPNYDGPIPDGLTPIHSPTDLVWMIGRIEALSESDLVNVAAIQSQIDLRPLSAYGEAYTPPVGLPLAMVDQVTPTLEQVQTMGPEEFFGTLARLLEQQPPPEADAEVLANLRKIGVTPGEFDYPALPAHIREGLERGMSSGRALIDFASNPGWGDTWGPSADIPLGDYGTEYMVRAVVAQTGFGANRREDAVYLNAARDSFSLKLDGSARSYIVRFEPGELPPVGAFWSLSMYDSDGYFVENPLDRYVLGSHQNLAMSADGSLEIRIDVNQPSDAPASHWLPAPDGPFELTLRAYWPSEELIDGTWNPPTITPVWSWR